jgi:hypothetical protein
MSNKIIILNKNNLEVGNSIKNKYVFKFLNSQRFDGQIALANIIMPYSTPNIYVDNCKLLIRYNNIDTNITIPTGFYTIETLNYYLQYIQQQPTNNIPYNIVSGVNQFFISLLYNSTYYSIEIRISPAILNGQAGKNNSTYNNLTPQVKILDDFNKIIGFPKDIYLPNNPQNSVFSTISKDYNLVPNLSPSNVYQMRCNLVNNNINIPSDILYSFSPNTTYGSLININPHELLYVDINNGLYNELSIEFFDERNQKLVILDENLVITLYLKLNE